MVPPLKDPKESPSTTTTTIATVALAPSTLGSPQFVPRWIYALYEIFEFYYRHQVFLPSFALSLLYLTVLSFGGQMVTYLISAGYNSFYIALVRTLSVIFELSATWIAPRAMKRMEPVRAAMWFLSWQMLWLAAAVSFFWAEPTSIIAASGLVGGTILSRIGLWGYDLCAQFIIQEVSAALNEVFRAHLIPLEGGARQSSRFLFLHRGFIPKRVRDAFICVDHYLVASKSIQVSSLGERCRGVYVSIPVWYIPTKEERTSCAFTRLHQRELLGWD